MHEKILITGADRGLGFGMTKYLLERGYIVYAMQYLVYWDELQTLKKTYPMSLFISPLDVSNHHSVELAVEEVLKTTDYLDMIINNAGIILEEDNHHQIEHQINDEDILKIFNVNALGSLRVVNQFLPLLERGNIKKLCFISSEAGSIECAKRKEMLGYCMSKSALNMMTKILFNTLRPKNYRFRLYHPGWIKSYMNGHLSTEGDLTIDEASQCAVEYFLNDLTDEDNLQMKDNKGNIWPW